MPASQPETRALISAFKSHPSFMYVDVHSRGDCIYYYRTAMDSAYNNRQYDMVNILSDYTGYSICTPENEIEAGDSGGNSVHYYSEMYEMPAFTIETARDNVDFPMNISLAEQVYHNVKNLPEAMICCCQMI